MIGGKGLPSVMVQSWVLGSKPGTGTFRSAGRRGGDGEDDVVGAGAGIGVGGENRRPQ